MNESWIQTLQKDRDEWIIKFNNATIWINDNPDIIFKHTDIDNNQMIHWIISYHQYYLKKKNIMNQKQIYNIWENFLITYPQIIDFNILYGDIHWHERLDELINWINTNKRKPYSRSKNSKECFLGKWLDKQYTHNHKASIIISKWNKFLSDYMIYIETSDMKWHKTIECILTGDNIYQKSKNNPKIKWLNKRLKNYKTNNHEMKDTKKKEKISLFLENKI